MMGLRKRLFGLRVGAVTGMNAGEKNYRMMGTLLAPFVAGWLAVKIFLPDALFDVGITVLMMGWLVWIGFLYAWAKSDAGNFIVFPQSKWKLPDGSCSTFDIKIPRDSWTKVAEYPDGSVGYKVFFSDKFLIDDADLPYPIVFDCAYWMLPAVWDVAFQRQAFGEFFHKGVYVTKPDCEDISLYVIGYEEKEGVIFPICLVNDCAFTYAKALEGMRVPELMRADNPVYLLYRTERQRANKLMQHTSFVEDLNAINLEDNPADFKKSAESVLKGARKRHRSIMDTGQSWSSRILNLKTLAFVVVALAAFYLVGHFLLGLF